MIDPANIPKKYGGQLEFEYGMPPLLDASILDELTWTNAEYAAKQTFPRGPMRLHEEKDGTLSILTLGSVDGTPRREQIASLQPQNQRVKRTATNTTASVLATAAESSRPTSIAPAESDIAATAAATVPPSSIPRSEPISAEKTLPSTEPLPNGISHPPEPAIAAVPATHDPIVEPVAPRSEISRPDLTQQKTEFFDAPEPESDLKQQDLPSSKGHSLTNGSIQEPA
jgi:hypothetical protein